MKKELKNQIISKLEDYLTLHKMSANVFCKKTGINANIMSSIRNGSETVNAGNGTTAVIADKYFEIIAEFIGLEIEKSYWDIVPTLQLQRILATLEDAKEFGYINPIIGETGCGKTIASNLFAKRHPNDCFVITVSSSDNIGDLMDKIIDSLKITTAKTKSKKLRAIVLHLRELKFSGYKPMLIFDEAEYMKQPALCSMKELYDNLHTICSIILVGTNQLINNLDKLRKKNKDGIPQLYRRIKFGIRFLPAIDKTFKQFLNTIEDKELVRFLCSICDNYGELHDVLVPSMREADRTGQKLTVNFVRTILNLPNL